MGALAKASMERIQPALNGNRHFLFYFTVASPPLPQNLA